MKKLYLRQTFDKPISSPFEFEGSRQVFDWSIDTSFNDGYTRVGSWAANRWYEVKTGVTNKQTLSNARRKLSRMMSKKGLVCTFEYIEN